VSSAKDSLRRVVEELRDSPEFLAGWLAHTPGGDAWLSQRLGLDRDRLGQLLRCRSPRPSTFAADVEATAILVDVAPATLAETLREGVALTTLSAAAQERVDVPDAKAIPGLLAAARDRAGETISRGNKGGVYIRRLADEVRARSPRDAGEVLDVESFVAWTAPLAVVLLPLLNLSAAHGWLAERGVALGFGNRDRPLRGLLLAWRGSGLIFVDGSLSVSDRRFTVAHELGHFLLDYVAVRNEVLRRVPELVAVMDGHRSATRQDRARSILEGIPLGVHTHLLERDPHGSGTWEMERGEDLSTRFALELLSPWKMVRAMVRTLSPGLGWEARLDEATRLLAKRFQLPVDAARTRARDALESIGKGPGFFDR
jgi:hypothetical protein